MSWLDLHMHSCYSDDGQYTPQELMAICRRAGVHTAAIADHNSVRAIADAKKQALAADISLIPAIELDCVFNGVNLHLLGYWIDETLAAFAGIEETLLSQEQQAAHERLALVAALGIHLDRAEILRNAKQGIVTGELIAEAALADPKNDGNPLLMPYRPGGARGDSPFVHFYWDYCAQGKPAYVPIHYISLSEAVSLIRQSGGVPILAHPGNNIGTDEELLQAILSEGAEGLEAFSSYHTPEQTAFFRQKAIKFGAAITCGSDFHGKIKPNIKAGGVDCDGQEEELLAQLTKKRR